MRAAAWIAVVLLVLGALGWLSLGQTTGAPPGLSGTLVFVSDRSGLDAVFIRRLPGRTEERLASFSEPTGEPALSPNGREVAFSVGGRIGLVNVLDKAVTLLTLGVDWRDSAPAWLPDGKGLLVRALRPGEANGDIHLLSVERSGSPVTRRFLTETPGLDETTPVCSPDGTFVVFVREDNLLRLDLADGKTKRLTGGFRLMYGPRFLPSGRVLSLWKQDKVYGIDAMDADGFNRETLMQGGVYYRTISPSPDGKHLAVTFTFDLRFRVADALKLRQTEEVRLLDPVGSPVGWIARSWRHSNHSPHWGR